MNYFWKVVGTISNVFVLDFGNLFRLSSFQTKSNLVNIVRISKLDSNRTWEFHIFFGWCRITTSSAWDCLGLAADKECYTPVTFWIFTQFHFLECRFTASSAWECLGFGSRQRMLHLHFSGFFFLLFLGFWVICFFWILYWINHKGPSINDVTSNDLSEGTHSLLGQFTDLSFHSPMSSLTDWLNNSKLQIFKIIKSNFL